jgi:membrane protein YqaA with SNARE-associated domain
VTYILLFLITFASATILPLQSEAVLTAMLLKAQQPWLALLAVASFGNTLGAGVNWFLGREINRFRDRRWFPASPQRMAQAENIYARYGRWCLIFAWVPVIGDALTVVSGVLKEKLWLFLLLVGLGKSARYAALAAALAGFL